MGRPKGSVNKDKEAFRERMRRYCDETGTNPHQWMADILKKPGVTMEIKIQAAKELAQYLEPKLRSTEVTGDPDKPLAYTLQREDRQQMIAALLEKRSAVNDNGRTAVN